MASTATNTNISAASQRNKKLSSSSSPSSTSPSNPTKTSHRQAKPFKNEELHQFEVPNLTVKDLLSAIPAHCFKRSAIKSFAYVVQDFILTAILIYAASFIDPTLKSTNFSKSPLTPFLSESTQYSLSRFSLWALYSIAQGLVWTGIWVIAHECGHQGFSESKTLNNSVGWVLHSALLVPYHSWRISHARHHAATGHLTRDEVFVPRTRAQKGLLPLKPADADSIDAQNVDATLSGNAEKVQESVAQSPVKEEETWGEWLAETLEDAPLYNFIFVFVQQLLGWPLYLIQNASGQLHYPKGTNHFNPDAIIFDARHRQQVIVSDIGIALTLGALAAWGSYSSGGFGEVMRYYGVPYLWVNNWLVMITFLQHTDPLLPHYKAEAWTFPRGALCTVDRSWLGPVGPYLLHGIAETHVAHHVSSKIPHYNAWEATEALKERLGVHYQYNSDNIFVALWKTVRNCKYVEENDQVAFYRDAHGVPKATVGADSAYNSDSGLAMSE